MLFLRFLPIVILFMTSISMAAPKKCTDLPEIGEISPGVILHGDKTRLNRGDKLNVCIDYGDTGFISDLNLASFAFQGQDNAQVGKAKVYQESKKGELRGKIEAPEYGNTSDLKLILTY